MTASLAVLASVAGRGTAGGRFVFQHRPQFVDKIAGVGELPVHAGEPHVRNLVQLPQFAHHQFAQLPAIDLGIKPLLDLALHAVDQVVDLFVADGPFPAGFFQARLDPFSLVRHPRAVFFHHLDHGFFNPFIGGVTPVASQAFATAADHAAILAGAGIHDAVVVGRTIRALHRYNAGDAVPRPLAAHWQTASPKTRRLRVSLVWDSTGLGCNWG